jgi:hypothetical protein
MRAVRIRADPRDDLRPVGRAQFGADLCGRSGECRSTSAGEQHHLVAAVDVGWRCGCHHDDASFVGESSQRRRHLAFRCLVESGSRLVKDKQ